jgi:LmbE family N-acetylglucosaminyl deacetylase
MNHRFPPLLPKGALRPPVLVVVAHPDDEVIGCGAMLAWHASCGHAVTVAHMTAGAAGDPGARYDDIVATRRREGREALRRLGVTDLRSFDLPDGALPEHRERLDREIRALIAEIAPATLYTFFFAEAHRDHRAVAHAIAGAADALPVDCRVLLFGVNQAVVSGTMFEVGAQIATKQHALAAFESQLAYNDFRQKVEHRDHSATVNIEDNAVQYAEVFVDLRPRDLAQARDLVEAAHRFLAKDAT